MRTTNLCFKTFSFPFLFDKTILSQTFVTLTWLDFKGRQKLTRQFIVLQNFSQTKLGYIEQLGTCEMFLL